MEVLLFDSNMCPPHLLIITATLSDLLASLAVSCLFLNPKRSNIAT